MSRVLPLLAALTALAAMSMNMSEAGSESDVLGWQEARWGMSGADQ